jgi:pyruvate kinase
MHSILDATRCFLKKTKIICTLGPASSSKQVIEKMFQAGMNGVRINTAYGNLAQYQSVIETVREVADIRVVEKKDRKLRLLTLDGGVIEDGKGVNIPLDVVRIHG